MSDDVKRRQMADRKLRVQRLEERIQIYASSFAGWCLSEEGWSSEELEHVQLQYRCICDELVRLLRNQQPGELTCQWRCDGDEWSGECGAGWWWATSETLADSLTYCPGCGRPLEVVSEDAQP